MIVRHNEKAVNLANVYAFVKAREKEIEFISGDDSYISFGFPSTEARDHAFNTILSGWELEYLLIEI